MDTIWNCAFGVDIDVQNNPDNEYFTKCEKLFSNTSKINFLMYLGGKIYKILRIITKSQL